MLERKGFFLQKKKKNVAAGVGDVYMSGCSGGAHMRNMGSLVTIQGVQNPPCMGKGTQRYTLLMNNSSKSEEQISLYKL